MHSNKQNPKRLFNFTQDEIKEYLENFRKCVLEGRYTISINGNRRENMKFIEDYKIDTRKECEILLGIQFDDFCYAAENDNMQYPDEVLYIFGKRCILDFWGSSTNIEIYIKVNMIELGKGDLYSYVVSFHESNYVMKYLFR